MVGSTSSLAAFMLSALSLQPYHEVAADRVDLIEVNHYYDEHGRLVFDQIIFYDWSATSNRYHVRDWRMLKTPAQIPHRSWKQGKFIAIWRDDGVLRKVEAKAARESWTQYDPEFVEREFLPKDMRKKLKKR
jgi:hypothetical protein